MDFERLNEIDVRRTRSYTRFQQKLDALSDFPSFIEEFFSPFIKAAGHDRTFQWSAVEGFYNDNQDTLSICYALKMFCEFVLKLFLRFNCENERLMIRITHLYQRLKLRSHGHFDAIFCEDCEQLKCRKQNHLNSRPLLKEVNEKAQRFYNAQHFSKRGFYFYRQFFSYHQSYNQGEYAYYEFLRYLVKYGLIFIPNSEHAVAVRFNDLRFEYYDWRVVPHRPQFDQNLLNRLLRSAVNPNFRRLILIMEVVSNYFIIDGKDHHARSFKLYSLTTSEPAISQKEVQKFIYFSFANDERFKTSAFTSFKKVFASSPKLPSPRSLKHLSRCKIRDCLPSSPPMPTVLCQIELLPNCLKDYILFLTD